MTKILNNAFSAGFEVSTVAYFGPNLRVSDARGQSSTGYDGLWMWPRPMSWNRYSDVLLGDNYGLSIHN